MTAPVKRRDSPPERSIAKVYDYYVTTVGGMEEVVVRDIKDRLQGIRHLRVMRGQRHGRIFFHYERSPKRLLQLRSVDNVFALLAQVQGITTGKPGMRRIADQVARIDLKPAMALHDVLHGSRPDAGCRLVCTVAGRHRFSVGDLHRAIRGVLRSQWRVERETKSQAYILHVQVMGKTALLGLQLARRRLRDRPYRRMAVPGGLEATVAYSMAMLGEVKKGDVCLDPMCGGGTTLIEAGLAFRPQRLIGGDVSPASLAVARKNSRAARQAIDLVHWNANRLPLADASVDVLLCNLPYGKKVKEVREASESPVIPELARVIRPGRRAVLMAADGPAMDLYLRGPNSPFALQQRLRLHLRGVSPFLYVLEKRPTRAGLGEEQKSAAHNGRHNPNHRHRRPALL